MAHLIPAAGARFTCAISWEETGSRTLTGEIVDPLTSLLVIIEV
jgi:hypothetical protein